MGDLLNWFEKRNYSKALVLCAVVLLTEFIYVAIISVGKFDLKWPIQMIFYDQLADAFRAGQLHLPNGPHPKLIEQKNPYDPAFMYLWNLDATYFKGKYYIYWGPVPAVIQAVGKSLLGIKRTLGDQYLVFLFFSLNTIFSVFLLRRMASRLATGVPPWLVAASVFGVGLANPVAFLLASAGVYQAALAGAQAFLFLGVIFAFDAVWEPAHSERRVLMLLLAGTAWALSIGCRISLAFAVAPLVFCTIVCTSVTEALRFRRFIRDGLWTSAPIALGIFVLLYYNKVRFDEWLEFGLRYQLSAFPYRSSTAYILPDIDSYLFRAPSFDCRFPYVFATTENGVGPITNRLGAPPGYLLREPTIGLLYAVPMIYAMPFAIVAAAKKLGRGLFLDATSPFAAESRQRRTFVWFVACMLLAAAGPGLPTVMIFTATMRYLCDFTNAFLFLSILGIFTWYGRPVAAKLVRGLRVAITLTLIGATVVFGTLLGYEGYLPYFRTHNPELHRVLAPALSLCER